MLHGLKFKNRKNLLHENLLSFRTPANYQLAVAFRNALRSQLYKELEVPRATDELLHLDERNAAGKLADDTIQDTHIFRAVECRNLCDIDKMSCNKSIATIIAFSNVCE